MSAVPEGAAAIAQPAPDALALSGDWTSRGLGSLERRLDGLRLQSGTGVAADASGIRALDTAGAWILQDLLQRLRAEGHAVTLEGLRPEHARMLELVSQRQAGKALERAPPGQSAPGVLHGIGIAARDRSLGVMSLLSFVGESATALARCIVHPSRLRGRPVLYNIRSAGFDAIPIVSLLSFLLGVVIAYQGAAQLRQYGANIFIADLVGLSMVREFGPLLTAILIAGRSGSAYAAQIGTMSVTEEIDAMRTLGMAPLEVLVVPKVLALLVAMPLLTVLADAFGIFGGMAMAQAQLDVGYADFLDRLLQAVSVTAYLVGILKAPVFAAIIAMVGCYQGFQTRGGADSVGRQTTRSVVQAIFLVIVADALLSVALSALDL